MNKSKVLIIEDESITAMELQKKLQLWGYPDPIAVASGENALELLEKVKPDLLLVDIKLQGDLDGIETVQEIKKKKDIPVIYITSFLDKDITQKAKATRPYSYLIKPLNMNELHINIELALDQHREFRKKIPKLQSETSLEIYSFTSTFISPLTHHIPIQKRNDYLLEFSENFKKKYSSGFKEQIQKQTLVNRKSLENLPFETNTYLTNLVKLFARWEFNFQIIHKGQKDYLVSSECPWNLKKSYNNFMCLICQLIMKNTIEWAPVNGSVIHKSSLPNGYDNCVFEFKFKGKK